MEKITKIGFLVVNFIGKVLMSHRNGLSVAKTAKINYLWINKDKNVTLNVGAYSTVYGRISFVKPNASVIIGRNVVINNSALLCAKKITVGDGVLISWGCTITDYNFHALLKNHRKRRRVAVTKSIKIDDGAWIGFNSIILKGVTIGEGAIVGAGSVVTRNVEPHTVVAGNPAKFIRRLKEGD